MPIYEYRCTDCDHLLEVFAKMSDPPPLACEACGGTSLVKVLHPVAVHYKGSGFYATDYGKSSKRGSGSSDSSSSESGSSSSGSDGGKSGSDSSSSSSGDSSSGSGGSGSKPSSGDSSGSSSSSGDS